MRKKIIFTGAGIFFIVAFTLSFLAFSIGNSAINAQNKRLSRYTGDNNHIIQVFTNYNFTNEEMVELLKEQKITIQLSSNIIIEDKVGKVTTELKSDGLSRLCDLRYGHYLSKDEYLSDENMGVFSTGVTNKKKFTLRNIYDSSIIPIEVEEIGKTFDTSITVDVPNNIFFSLLTSDDFVEIIFSGEPEEIKEAVDKLDMFLKEKDTDSIVGDYELPIDENEVAGKQMFGVSILIVIITILNSINICGIWVTDNKKELLVRKVCGATDFDLIKDFFIKLLCVSLISLCIAISTQEILAVVLKGVFLNIDIRLHMQNLIYSLIFSVGITLISSIPALYYIMRVQPAKMLNEE